MTIAIRRLIIAAILLLPPLAPAVAAQAQGGDPEPQTVPQTKQPEGPFEGKKVADETALDHATAREDLSLLAQSQQASSVSQSSVNGPSTTGEIGFAGNAFQNATGLTVVNANSGNNVAMNASLNVNIIMTGPQ